MLSVLSLLAILALILLQWRFALGMGREISLYAAGALAERPQGVRDAGRVVGFLLGFALWLPLVIFNLFAFKTAWPVSKRQLVPRRL